jgi:hypothetical protein
MGRNRQGPITVDLATRMRIAIVAPADTPGCASAKRQVLRALIDEQIRVRKPTARASMFNAPSTTARLAGGENKMAATSSTRCWRRTAFR